jgi:protein transport protein SEC23
MRSLSEKTGGYIIMNEEFNSSVFKETYQKIFAKDPNDELKMCTAAKIEMFVSKELKISGALG